TRMPGERRYREREVADEEGVALTEQELQDLKALLG
ncbi:Ldh family oxidoreductase, partial [Klebsiella pneumoniae]|nr:Ldh family oxidoreductase [Klebsiella pneumoniae]